jgi:hypothetical protein
MKTAISLLGPVFRSAEQLANRLGLSRSELYCRALRDLLARHDQLAVTEQLDAVYGFRRTIPASTRIWLRCSAAA